MDLLSHNKNMEKGTLCTDSDAHWKVETTSVKYSCSLMMENIFLFSTTTNAFANGT